LTGKMLRARWDRMTDLESYKPNEKILDWGELKPRTQDEVYKWTNVLWRIIHYAIKDDDDEDPIRWMWLEIYFHRWIRLRFDKMDFDFIKRKFRREHMFWSLWIECLDTMDRKWMQPGIVRKTQKQKRDQLPKRWRSKAVPPPELITRAYVWKLAHCHLGKVVE